MPKMTRFTLIYEEQLKPFIRDVAYTHNYLIELARVIDVLDSSIVCFLPKKSQPILAQFHKRCVIEPFAISVVNDP